MTNEKVVITGLGVVSGYGAGYEALCTGLASGKPAYKERFISDSMPNIVCASFDDSDKYLTNNLLKNSDRVVQLSMLALDEALLGYDGCINIPGDKIGVYMGCAMGGLESLDAGYKRLYQHGLSPSPLSIIKGMSNGPAAEISIRLGACGPSINHSMACASSSYSIRDARLSLLNHETDVVIAGGVETPLFEGSLAAWRAMRIMNPSLSEVDIGCRPFSSARKGLILGEGAIVFIMERLSDALKKDKKIFAVIDGIGVSTDATHLSAPNCKGQIKAIKLAMKDACCRGKIDYYNAHGTGTVAGDLIEAASIQSVWPEVSTSPSISATKSLTGHLLGAAGALELAICIYAMKNNHVPPTAWLKETDEQFSLNIVGENGQSKTIKTIMSTSFAFGGHNAAIIMSDLPR